MSKKKKVSADPNEEVVETKKAKKAKKAKKEKTPMDIDRNLYYRCCKHR